MSFLPFLDVPDSQWLLLSPEQGGSGRPAHHTQRSPSPCQLRFNSRDHPWHARRGDRPLCKCQGSQLPRVRRGHSDALMACADDQLCSSDGKANVLTKGWSERLWSCTVTDLRASQPIYWSGFSRSEDVNSWFTAPAVAPSQTPKSSPKTFSPSQPSLWHLITENEQRGKKTLAAERERRRGVGQSGSTCYLECAGFRLFHRWSKTKLFISCILSSDPESS
jgi:hypothetical protein